MLKIVSLLLPLLLLGLFGFALFKKVKIYPAFVEGIGSSLSLMKSIFPYLMGIFILCELFEQSGLYSLICEILSPVCNIFCIPKEMLKFLLIKPFSGSGATATFIELLNNNPPDSYIVRCAAVCYGSSETVFYLSAVYFSQVKGVKLTGGIVISLFCSFVGAVVSCLLCRLF